ncbi:MAG TPA: hypothetical protein VNF04_14685, partial [Stellaceae bacterium]|nr:hypothetical protein [Stellaceae bacterium]
MNAVVDFPVKPEARDYLARFARDPREPGWLAARRQQAMTRFAELGFPTRRSESWRYLDLQPLQQQPLLPEAAHALPEAAVLRERIAGLSLGAAGPRLVLVDGHVAAAWSTGEVPQGVWFGAMARAVAERPDLARAALGDGASEAAHPFAALNAAFFADGYILDVPPGMSLDEPIEVIHLASGISTTSFHTRSLVRLGAGSRANLLDVYVGEGRYWRNDVVTLQLAERAELSRTVVVEESAQAVHLA